MCFIENINALIPGALRCSVTWFDPIHISASARRRFSECKVGLPFNSKRPLNPAHRTLKSTSVWMLTFGRRPCVATNPTDLNLYLICCSSTGLRGIFGSNIHTYTSRVTWRQNGMTIYIVQFTYGFANAQIVRRYRFFNQRTWMSLRHTCNLLIDVTIYRSTH